MRSSVASADPDDSNAAVPVQLEGRARPVYQPCHLEASGRVAVQDGVQEIRETLGFPTPRDRRSVGPTEEVWQALCHWACKEALERSWGRHELKMEDGVGPILSSSEVE